MTVSTTASDASFAWTGGESVFACNFPAEAEGDLLVKYTPTGGSQTTLIMGQHYAVTLDANKIASLTPLTMPAAPGVVYVERDTSLLQPVAFADNETFSAATHENLHDSHVLRAQEQQRRVNAISNRYAVGPGSFVYPDKASIDAAIIPDTTTLIFRGGYYDPGDPGQTAMKKIATGGSLGPGQQASADGAWWEVATTEPRGMMFGARGNNSADDRAALYAADAFCAARNLTLIIDAPHYLGSSLTFTAPVLFANGGRLRPAAHCTVGFPNGVDWPATASFIFDFSATGAGVAAGSLTQSKVTPWLFAARSTSDWTAALNTMFPAHLALGGDMGSPRITYNCAGQVYWDTTGHIEGFLSGDFTTATKIIFAPGVASPNFAIYSSSDTDKFYGELRGLHVSGNVDGLFADVSRDDLSEPWNKAELNLVFANASQGASASVLRLNTQYTTGDYYVQANGPGNPLGVGNPYAGAQNIAAYVPVGGGYCMEYNQSNQNQIHMALGGMTIGLKGGINCTANRFSGECANNYIGIQPQALSFTRNIITGIGINSNVYAIDNRLGDFLTLADCVLGGNAWLFYNPTAEDETWGGRGVELRVAGQDNTGMMVAVFTGSITGNVLTISSIFQGFVRKGSIVTTSGGICTIESFGTGVGLTGTYNVSAIANQVSQSMTATFGLPNGTSMPASTTWTLNKTAQWQQVSILWDGAGGATFLNVYKRPWYDWVSGGFTHKDGGPSAVFVFDLGPGEKVRYDYDGAAGHFTEIWVPRA